MIQLEYHLEKGSCFVTILHLLHLRSNVPRKECLYITFLNLQPNTAFCGEVYLISCCENIKKKHLPIFFEQCRSQ